MRRFAVAVFRRIFLPVFARSFVVRPVPALRRDGACPVSRCQRARPKYSVENHGLEKHDIETHFSEKHAREEEDRRFHQHEEKA